MGRIVYETPMPGQWGTPDMRIPFIPNMWERGLIGWRPPYMINDWKRRYYLRANYFINDQKMREHNELKYN